MKLIDGMGGNPRAYQEAREPLGLSRPDAWPRVQHAPERYGEARGKPPRRRAWLRDHKVSSNEVGFNLRGI